jgi:hypothetical protein
MQALTNPTPGKAARQTRPSGGVPFTPLRDALGYRISGANATALERYQHALADWQGWRSGAELALTEALAAAPHFVMAHLLQAWLCLCSRDPQRVALARPLLARALRLPANERERMHIDAMRAALDDDFDGAKAWLGHLLRRYPRDAVALQAAHVFDYGTGDLAALDGRVASVLPAWSRDMPGYHAVLAMHAFSLEECGHYDFAADQAAGALALEPRDARAHHVMAHLFEMTDRPADGVQWMHERQSGWLGGTVVATHCWWHIALFYLEQGDVGRALACYDTRVRAGNSAAVADLVDASSLLWRIALAGADTGARWAELAKAWAPHVDDGFCSFNDLHAMLAFVGAGDWPLAQRLERSLLLSRAHTRHGATTRELGLPACRALMAFGRGDDLLAITLLASLPALAHRMGGSHAQRDVLNLTLLRAVERVRRPARRHAAALAGAGTRIH